MPDGKPTKAPLIIFGTMVTMSIITVGIVFFTHARRTEPYLDSKMRRVKEVEPKAPTSEADSPTHVLDGDRVEFDGGPTAETIPDSSAAP